MKIICLAADNLSHLNSVDFQSDARWKVQIDRPKSYKLRATPSIQGSIPSIGHIAHIEVLGLNKNELFQCSITNNEGNISFSEKISSQHSCMHATGERLFLELNVVEPSLVKASLQLTELEEDLVDLNINRMNLSSNTNTELEEHTTIPCDTARSPSPSCKKILEIGIHQPQFDALHIGIAENDSD